VLQKDAKGPEHKGFKDILSLIPDRAIMVLNDTKVVPARIPVLRSSGGQGEMLIQYENSDTSLRAIGRPSKRLKVGEILNCERNPSVQIKLLHYHDNGQWDIEFVNVKKWPHDMDDIGEIPLPPYIERKNGPEQEDLEQYQTVFNTTPGSAAAPTASLHFTEELLEQLSQKGVSILKITHHVGSGTFLPMRADDVEDHQMHTEQSFVSKDVALALREAKSKGQTIVAVGTTVVRALESGAEDILAGEAYHGKTDLFIYPPFNFRLVDHMVTNFHLPESTLMMLVSAFADRERILAAYNEAVSESYRFFSYGDAMYLERYVL
jgi:S-adenosylmethionine:tRNA ribosyltransferase-isomerase